MPLLPGENEDDDGFLVVEPTDAADDADEADDIEGGDDDIAAKLPGKMRDEDDEDADEDEDGDGERFEVEKVIGHDWAEDKTLILVVKWKGYPIDEATEESEKTMVEDAPETVDAYYKRLGGRPSYEDETRKKRKADRSSQSLSHRGRKKAKSEDADVQPMKPKSKKDWLPPKGSWENDVNSIDAVEETDMPNGETQVMGYLIWNNNKRTKHDLLLLHEKCPRKMLQFYYDHLRFTYNGPSENYPKAEPDTS